MILIHLKIKFKVQILELLFVTPELFPGSSENLTIQNQVMKLELQSSWHVHNTASTTNQGKDNNDKVRSAFFGIPKTQSIGKMLITKQFLI